MEVPEDVFETSGRVINAEYQEKLVTKVLSRAARKAFLPMPVRIAWDVLKSTKYIWQGVRCLASRKLEVSVLDATAIGVSMFRGEFATASSVMFLLEIGEILEEWTHKKAIGDLARSMSLRVDKVWVRVNGTEVLMSVKEIKPGDEVIVRTGNVIPFDGRVLEGEGMINQSSLTGESLPVHRNQGATVFAGTVVEEGEITIAVKKVSGASRYEKIVEMIEDSEKLKSGAESKAEHLADKLVPFTFLGTAVVWAASRNVTKALTVLMVDYFSSVYPAVSGDR